MHSSDPRDGDNALARAATIGRYMVLGLVGKGAMGEVYAAYDPELDRKVAIKLLRVRGDQGSVTDGRARLMREAQAIAKLSHPNVVTVYDVGTFQDQVFIAMQFVEGHTVGYWMHAQPRAWSEVLKTFADAGRGLAAAHEKDLIHRDFKPENVMVSEDGHVRVMDFGLARVVVDRERTHAPVPAPTHASAPALAPAPTPTPMSTSTPATAPAVTSATPAHAPAAPTPATATPPTAVAAVGADDFDAESTRATGRGNAIPVLVPGASSQALKLDLTQTGAMLGTPAYMSPEQFSGSQVDARTDQFSFCVALYEALYGERPFAGNTLIDLTSSVLKGNVRAAPATTKVPPWLRKILLRGLCPKPDDRWPSMTALLVELEKNRSGSPRRRFSAGASAKLAGIWGAPIRGRAVETEAKAEMRQAFLATGKRYAAAAFENASRILDHYAKTWSDMYTDACEATHVRGEQSPEVLDLRMASLQEGLDSLNALVRVFRMANAEVVENAVSAATALGSLERCADVKLLRALVKPPEDPQTRAAVDVLRTQLAEVRVLCQVGRLGDGLRLAIPLEQEVRRTGYRPLLAETLCEIGILYIEQRDAKAAALAFEEAVWTAELCRHDEITAKAAAQLVYAVGCAQLHFEAGEIWARHADTILRRMGGHDLLWGWLFTNRGSMRVKQGRVPEALVDARRAVASKENAHGPDNPDAGASLSDMAIYLEQMGDVQGAVVCIERSVKILETSLGPEHPRTGIALSNYSEILNRLGRFEESRVVSGRALAIFESDSAPNSAMLAYPLTALGLGYLDDGMAEQALPILERAAEIREGKENDPAVRGEVHFALARALYQLRRDLPRARSLLELARVEYAEAPSSPFTERALTRIDAMLADNEEQRCGAAGSSEQRS